MTTSLRQSNALRFVILIAMILLHLMTSRIDALEITGHANTWSLIQTDDLDSVVVAEVYRVSNNALVGVVVGADIKTVCANTLYRCVYRTIGAAGELSIERRSDAGTTNHGAMSGYSALYNLGVNAKATEGPWLTRVNGNFTGAALNQRTLLGHDTYRFRFTDLYQQYTSTEYQVSLGRKAVMGGAVVDGLDASYFFGPENSADSKSIGFFLGFAPDPISKNPSKDFVTFGPTFRFISDFSSQSESKLLAESSLISELYKGDLNRFYLYSRINFTPTQKFSVQAYNTLDLPWSGYDGEIKSTLFSVQTHYRPKSQWFYSIGFTQFRIQRYLQEDAVRWVTDDTRQIARIGDSLDKSQRYRVDFRASYRPNPEMQPYVKARFERRTFDSNKTLSNINDGSTANPDFSLLTRTSAYQGTLGLRLYVLDHLDSDTSATLIRRFQSSGWNGSQTLLWEQGKDWSADASFLFSSSNRTLKNSVATVDGSQQHAYDLYASVGGGYRFMTDFQLQVHYDWANEDDKQLDERITTHTGLIRVDYTF